MKLKALIPLFTLMVAVAGCGHSQKDVGMTEPAVQAEETAGETGITTADGQDADEAESGTDHVEPAISNGQEVTLTPEEIGGAVINGGYHIDSINTDAVRIRIPDEIGGTPVVSVAGYMIAADDIESVTFPDSMESIGQAMFNACDKLTYVELGKGLKYIGPMAFNSCGALERVVFPEGMESFEDVIFFNCKNLKEVYVPASVTEFGENTPVLDPKTCPDAVVVTPAGSPAEMVCTERGVPVRTE